MWQGTIYEKPHEIEKNIGTKEGACCHFSEQENFFVQANSTLTLQNNMRGYVSHPLPTNKHINVVSV